MDRQAASTWEVGTEFNAVRNGAICFNHGVSYVLGYLRGLTCLVMKTIYHCIFTCIDSLGGGRCHFCFAILLLHAYLGMYMY